MTRCAITDHQVVLERMRFPDPVISVSVKAEDQGRSQEKFGAALGKMVRADPSLHLETDRETSRPFCAAWASCTSK